MHLFTVLQYCFHETHDVQHARTFTALLLQVAQMLVASMLQAKTIPIHGGW